MFNVHQILNVFALQILQILDKLHIFIKNIIVMLWIRVDIDRIRSSKNSETNPTYNKNVILPSTENSDPDSYSTWFIEPYSQYTYIEHTFYSCEFVLMFSDSKSGRSD